MKKFKIHLKLENLLFWTRDKELQVELSQLTMCGLHVTAVRPLGFHWTNELHGTRVFGRIRFLVEDHRHMYSENTDIKKKKKKDS